MMTTLLTATLSFAFGLLAGLRFVPATARAAADAAAAGTGPGVVLVAIMLAAATAGVILALRPQRPRVIALFIIAGCAVGAVRARSAAVDCREQLADGAQVRLIAVPLVQPLEGASTRLHARALHAGAIECAAVIVRAHAQPRMHAQLDSAAHGRSNALLLSGRWLAYPRRNDWPRQPEYAGGVLIDSIAVAAASSDDRVRRAGMATRLRTAQQQRLRALLPERWGLAEALLLAQKAGLDRDTRTRWVAAGLVHMLAISGMHVGLIASGVLLMCTALGLPRRSAARCALLITAAYVVFLGAPSAALRALLQAALLLCSLELQRSAEPFTALAAAALVILLIEPLALLDPGFQLSFAGMTGLIGWRRPIARLLPPRLPKYVRAGIAAGIAASALTTPIAALHFGTASWVGIFATLLAVPVMAAAIALVLVALIVAALTGSTSGIHAFAADLALLLLDRIAECAARVPGGHGFVSAHAVLLALAAVAAVIVARRVLLRRSADSALAPPSHAAAAAHAHHARRHVRRRLRLLYAGGIGLVVFAWGPLLLRPHDDRIEIHAIDVGQGDAFAIRTPKNRWILVDAGQRTHRRDAGRDDVVPYLLARGARRIDALILTHPDGDHIGGAAAILDAFAVGIIIDPGLAAGKDMFIDLLRTARTRDQRWIAGRDGIVFNIDDVQVALLYPFAALDAAAGANDNSVVFRLTYGSFAALFTGDAPVSVERELIARHGAGMRATLLKVGHHGSTTSTSDSLLIALRPSIAVVSAGRNNRYGHPAPSVLRRLEARQVRVLRTDEHGDITVRAYRDGRVDVLTR
ncbi:MAG TPA: ComEC/Rec2 family competence protein [Longimicrobiales bacterium]|nr:ComEC/Rec2 family competence protein [Longimicrobiales bacterium]